MSRESFRNPLRPELRDLLDQLRIIEDLQSVSRLLDWDQATYMPPAGAEARGRQLSLLARLAHERQISPGMRQCLDTLRDLEAHDTAEGALVRRARRAYERAVRLPEALVSDLHEHAAASYVAWAKARPASDVQSLLPYLERTLELSRRIADYFPEAEHVADPLIDEADPGMTTARVRALFGALRERLVPFVERLSALPTPRRDFLFASYDPDKQLAFGREVIECMGYDFARGRQDLTHHPFMTRFGAGDVRITTRVRERDLSEALFSTVHEAGHALYEQSIDPSYDGTPLGHGTSMAVHESQSRLWENLVARSRPFWTHFYPRLAEMFPGPLAEVDVDTFHRAINCVERSLIRTDADEVTYNLHVMLRFDLEVALLEGTLAVRDLPEAWNSRMREDLKVEPPDAARGVLQDVHWFAGTIGGAFQGYTLGNLIAAQVYAAAEAALPTLPQALARGELQVLREWLTEHVYRHGGRYDTEPLVQRVCGAPLSIEPFMSYLEAKFGGLYGV